jgi:hypothetical protein
MTKYEETVEYIKSTIDQALYAVFTSATPPSALQTFRMKLAVDGLRLDDSGHIWDGVDHIADCDLASIKWKEEGKIVEATVKPFRHLDFVMVELNLDSAAMRGE